MIDASCTKLYYPSPRLFGPRVFLEINGAKNQNARSAEDEERNEVVPPDGWGGFQPRYFISWIERRRGRGLCTVVKSYPRRRRLINYRLYRSLDVPRDCSGLIADLTVILYVYVCVYLGIVGITVSPSS